MINNDDPCCYTYKRQRTDRKQNGLYVGYKLSKADLMSDLYQNYINISNKRLQDTRRTYLVEQEKVYENNNMVFPKWAQKELEHLRKIKNNNNSRYRGSNWAYWQGKNIQYRNAYKNLIQDLQDLQDNNVENDCIERLKRYEEEIKLCQQLNNENQEAKKNNQEKQKKIVSKKEYEKYLSAKKQEVKKKYYKLREEKGLYPTNKYLNMPKKIKELINSSNTIDLDEDKMEQNQQINK